MTFISNPTGGFGAGGNKSMKTALKAGRTFYFSSWSEVDRFCRQHDIKHDEIEAKGKTYSYTHK